MLELPGGRLLIDAPPELRLQLVAAGIDRIDGLWITHPHADHVHGLDDVRIFTVRTRSSLPTWLASEHRAQLETRFAYVFDPSVSVPPGTSKPHLEVRAFEGDVPVEVLGATLTPLPVPHGPMTVYGFRVGSLGYVTDAKSLTPAVADALQGVEVLVLNALWWGRPHPTHFNIEEAVEAARRVGAGRTWLIHLTHRVRHAELEARLPSDVRPAWDGLTLEIP